MQFITVPPLFGAGIFRDYFSRGHAFESRDAIKLFYLWSDLSVVNATVTEIFR